MVGTTTAVDTVALAAAARAASARAQEVLSAASAASSPFVALAGELPGAQVAGRSAGAGRAVGGVLGELGRAMGSLGQLLDTAAAGYAGAEAAASRAVPGGGRR